MSARRLRLAVLLVVGAVQLSVPIGMIVARERVLAEGAVWRFRTAPVDPADPFRGRYVALSFDQSTAPVPEGLTVEHGEQVIVPLSEGPDGFARLGPVRRESPEKGEYLRLRVHWIGRTEEGERPVAHVQLPFDRLYLEEGVAPRAEEVYRELTGGEEALDAWAVVRVLGGRAVLEDVVVEGRSLRELAAAPASASPGAAASR